MLKRVLVLAMAAGAMVFAGCDDKSDTRNSDDGGASSAGRVAVVDLSKILQDIGQTSKIEEGAQVRDQNLQMSVRVLQQNVQVKLVSLAREIGERPEMVGDNPTDAEQTLIDEWVAKMQNLERARLDAGNKIRQAYNQQRQANQQAIRAEIAKMRDRIKPLAHRIARERGLDIVIDRSSVLAHDSAIDITAAVFKEVNELLKAGEFPTATIPEVLKVVRQPTATAEPNTPQPD